MSNDAKNKMKANLDKFLKSKEKDQLVERFSESKHSTISNWVSSGSYALNKVVSGSYFKGIPHGRITGFAGESGVGKSFVCANIIKEAQDDGYLCFIFDSESAIDNKFMTNIGVDIDALARVSINTVSDFRNKTFQYLDEIHKSDPDQKILIVLDSLGNLVTEKELSDTEADKNAADMGLRAKELKAASRVLTNKVAMSNAAMVVTNHTYEQPASNPKSAPTTVFAGGKGFVYCCSTIVFLRKLYDRDSADKKKILGNRLIAVADKNRFVPEKTQSEMYVSRQHGLQKIYGIIDDACDAGIFEKAGSRIRVPHLENKTFYAKEMMKPSNYDKFWGPVMDELNEWVEKTYAYSSVEVLDEEDELDDMDNLQE
jgi:recombination protein RecA